MTISDIAGELARLRAEVVSLQTELTKVTKERDQAVKEYGFLMDSLPPDYFKLPPCECGR